MVVEMIDRGRAFAPNGLPRNPMDGRRGRGIIQPMGVNR